jgi:acyl carrier protein
MSQLTREKIKTAILVFCRREFEMENPGLDDDLREEHGFDSIDAIDLLLEIENLLDTELTHEEKKQAIHIRTLNQVCDYVEMLAKTRSLIGEHGRIQTGAVWKEELL